MINLLIFQSLINYFHEFTIIFSLVLHHFLFIILIFHFIINLDSIKCCFIVNYLLNYFFTLYIIKELFIKKINSIYFLFIIKLIKYIYLRN
jgi:hypothetical protein